MWDHGCDFGANLSAQTLGRGEVHPTAIFFFSSVVANFRLSDQDQDVHRAVDAGVESGVRARNVSWGSCLQWPSTFDWKWKTVEFFCPITCSWAAREGFERRREGKDDGSCVQ